MMNYWHWPTIFIYSISTLLSIFLANVYSKRNKIVCNNTKLNIKIIDLLIVLLPLILIIGLRDVNTGTDLKRYVLEYLNSTFLNIWNLDLTIREPLFSIYLVLINRIFNGNVQAFLFLTSFVPFLFLSFTIKKEYKLTGIVIPIIFYVCLLYFRSFSMLRQIIALSIVLYAYTFIREKAKYRYVFLAIIAMGFHYTAIIAIPLYFFSTNSRIGFIKKMFYIFGLILFIFFGDALLNILTTDINGKYSIISDRRVSFGIGNFITRLPMFLLVYVNKKSLLELNPNIKPYISIYLLNIFVAQTLYVNPLFERFTIYTEMPLLFILPTLYVLLKKKYGILSKICFTMVFIIQFYYTLYYYIYINPYSIVPYGLLV